MNGRQESENQIRDKTLSKISRMPSFMREWYYHLEAAGCTAMSCNEYVNKAIKYLKTLDENGDVNNVTTDMITPASVDSYMVNIRTTNKNGNVAETSGSYQQTNYHVLYNLMEFLSSRNYIKENYLKHIKCPKNRDIDRINSHRILLTKDDFAKMLSFIENNGGTYRGIRTKRDKAILELFMMTGMRESALVSINIEDIDRSKNILTVIDKGNKRHEYLLSHQVMSCIDDYIKSERHGATRGALFTVASSHRVTVRCVQQMVRKCSRESLGYEVSPHKLRAGFCSILYDTTHDIEFVRRSVGHSNVATTQRYIVRDNLQDREKANEILSSIFE